MDALQEIAQARVVVEYATGGSCFKRETELNIGSAEGITGKPVALAQ